MLATRISRVQFCGPVTVLTMLLCVHECSRSRDAVLGSLFETYIKKHVSLALSSWGLSAGLRGAQSHMNSAHPGIVSPSVCQEGAPSG